MSGRFSRLTCADFFLWLYASGYGDLQGDRLWCKHESSQGSHLAPGWILSREHNLQHRSRYIALWSNWYYRSACSAAPAGSSYLRLAAIFLCNWTRLPCCRPLGHKVAEAAVINLSMLASVLHNLKRLALNCSDCAVTILVLTEYSAVGSRWNGVFFWTALREPIRGCGYTHIDRFSMMSGLRSTPMRWVWLWVIIDSTQTKQI